MTASVSGGDNESKLRVLCVGTGRDGTQSVTHMIQHLLDRTRGGQAMHEFRCRELYHAFCQRQEAGGDPASSAALADLVADFPFECVVGNGYAAVLPLFAARYGRGLKLIHLRRVDRAACVASLVRNCEAFPTAFGYYSSSPEATVKRMAAFHFGEMSRQEWDRLAIEQKFGWYYDKTHALIDSYRSLFDDPVEIETERLDGEEARRALARVVAGPDVSPPPRTHLNAAVIDIASFPREHQHKMHWLMGRLNLEQVATDEVYPLDYFLEKFIAWTGYQITDAPQIAPSRPAPPEKIRADLDRALNVVRDRLREMETLRTLFERHHPVAPAVSPFAPLAPQDAADAQSSPAGVAAVSLSGHTATNDLLKFAGVFDFISPWRGEIPTGYILDFLGNLTPKEFREPSHCDDHRADSATIAVPPPAIGRGGAGECFWFEALNWLLAAKEARGHFVMMTLGALYGYQAVGCCRALQRLNPMPYKLVAVEPVPENMRRLRRMLRDNGIDPDDQWLIEAVVSGTHEPAFFPVGAPGAGSQNCISTDDKAVREDYFKRAVAARRTNEMLRSLLLHNSTGLHTEIAGDHGAAAEIKLVSCITIGDLLGPFDRVDYIEADMQESEIRAFPPFLDLLRRKVKRLHIATHGAKVHSDLHELFAANGWQIVFSYAPDSTHATPLGPLVTNDGVLTVVNPNL